MKPLGKPRAIRVAHTDMSDNAAYVKLCAHSAASAFIVVGPLVGCTTGAWPLATQGIV
jgi:hypothetical protein